jgi:hypothetical protein
MKRRSVSEPRLSNTQTESDKFSVSFRITVKDLEYVDASRLLATITKEGVPDFYTPELIDADLIEVMKVHTEGLEKDLLESKKRQFFLMEELKKAQDKVIYYQNLLAGLDIDLEH